MTPNTVASTPRNAISHQLRTKGTLSSFRLAVGGVEPIVMCLFYAPAKLTVAVIFYILSLGLADALMTVNNALILTARSQGKLMLVRAVSCDRCLRRGAHPIAPAAPCICMADALLPKTLVVIVASACAVGLFARRRLPAPVGYLLAGLIIGPHGVQLIAASDETEFLAELGIIFLMFMVGLEFSVPTMIAAGRDVFAAGALQVGLTTSIVAGGAMVFGISLWAALLLGAACAMSSTAITLKQLADQGEVSSHHGRLALGILLFQDLATLPFLVAIDAWQSGGEPNLADVARQLAIAAFALVAAALIARPVFRAALAWVARVNSADLFLLAVLLLALGTAFAGHLVGLAPPIGAFIAGMVVGESDFRHHVEDDIRPFRDVLLGLFFVTVGMEVNPAILMVAPMAVFVWLIVLLPGKAAIALLVGTIMRWPMSVGARVAVLLA